MCFAPSSCRETTSYDSCSSTRYGRQAWLFLAKNLPLSFILNKRILKARRHPVYASHWIPSSQNPPKMSSLRSNLAFTICYRITRQYVSSNRAIHSSAHALGVISPALQCTHPSSISSRFPSPLAARQRPVEPSHRQTSEAAERPKHVCFGRRFGPLGHNRQRETTLSSWCP